MNWRVWVFDHLRLNGPFVALVPAVDIHAAGSLVGAPSRKPFVVIAFGLESPQIRDGGKAVAVWQYMTLYAHGEAGDYQLIDSILVAARNALVGPVADGANGIMAEWQGSSTDLSDDRYGTIMKSADFKLCGKVA